MKNDIKKINCVYKGENENGYYFNYVIDSSNGVVSSIGIFDISEGELNKESSCDKVKELSNLSFIDKMLLGEENNKVCFAYLTGSHAMEVSNKYSDLDIKCILENSSKEFSNKTYLYLIKHISSDNVETSIDWVFYGLDFISNINKIDDAGKLLGLFELHYLEPTHIIYSNNEYKKKLNYIIKNKDKYAKKAVIRLVNDIDKDIIDDIILNKEKSQYILFSKKLSYYVDMYYFMSNTERNISFIKTLKLLTSKSISSSYINKAVDLLKELKEICKNSQ